MKKQKEIFISYSRRNKKEADKIDSSFKQQGLNLIRDERDLKPLGDIKEFMKRAAISDHVIVLISDMFLRSKYCMYEVLELLSSPKLDHQLIPIILPDANIDDTKKRIEIISYWNEKYEEINAQNLPLTAKVDTIIEDAKHYRNISENIDDFFKKLIEKKYWLFKDAMKEKFRPIFEHLKITYNEDLISQIPYLNPGIIPSEQNELAIEKLLRTYPEDYKVLFVAGYLSHLQKKLDKAKFYYIEIINKDNAHAHAHVHYNLALIYSAQRSLIKAREHFRIAIELSPNFGDAYLQFGIMLMNNREFKKSMSYFKNCISVAPQNELAWTYLGAIFIQLNDKKAAIENYRLAHSYFSKNNEFRIGLAYLLKDLDLVDDIRPEHTSYFENFNGITNDWRRPSTMRNTVKDISDSSHINYDLIGQQIVPPDEILASDTDYPRIKDKYHNYFINSSLFHVARAGVSGWFGISKHYMRAWSDPYGHTAYEEILPLDDEVEFIKAGRNVKAGDEYGCIASMAMLFNLELEVDGAFWGYLKDHGDSVDFDEPLAIFKILK